MAFSNRIGQEWVRQLSGCEYKVGGLIHLTMRSLRDIVLAAGTHSFVIHASENYTYVALFSK
jgi:hypothetical protein